MLGRHMIAAVLSATAGSALADTSVQIQLRGVVPKTCQVELVPAEAAAVVSIRCNYAGMAQVVLVRAGDGGVAYSGTVTTEAGQPALIPVSVAAGPLAVHVAPL